MCGLLNRDGLDLPDISCFTSGVQRNGLCAGNGEGHAGVCEGKIRAAEDRGRPVTRQYEVNKTIGETGLELPPQDPFCHRGRAAFIQQLSSFLPLAPKQFSSSAREPGSTGVQREAFGDSVKGLRILPAFKVTMREAKPVVRRARVNAQT